MEGNQGVIVSYQGEAMSQKGESHAFFKWMRLMHRWLVGWIMEVNQAVIFPDQGEAMAQTGGIPCNLIMTKANA